VRKSEKSFNGDIGIPLTILGCESGWGSAWKWATNILEGLKLILFKATYPDWLVLEVGADKPGDIEKIARWITPDIVVITTLPDVPVHVEAFPTPEDVAREKIFLAHALKKDGVLLLNYDDARVREIKKDFRSQAHYYGTEKGSDFRALDFALEYDDGVVSGIRFRVEHTGVSVPIVVKGVVGRQVMYQVLAALAVGSAIGLDIVTLAQVFTHYRGSLGRTQIIQGKKNAVLIDDTYNASPLAVHEALNTLEAILCKGKKIAVLGDMLELGKFSVKEHEKVGEHVASVADMLITVGVHARHIASSAQEHGLQKEEIFTFASHESQQAGEKLASLLGKGDVVLIKGSQGVRMERTTKAAMLHPEKAHKLLVRQEKAWLQKQ